MKKGFTLVELLMVVVIVGVLVTVALPKYQTALERGRALEGLSNLRLAADKANAYYVIHESYPPEEDKAKFEGSLDLVKNKFFEKPRYGVDSGGGTTAVIEISRQSSDWDYTLQARLSEGELQAIFCNSISDMMGTTHTCEQLGLTELMPVD